MAKNESDGRLDTVIGPQTSVRGDLHVTGGVRLDGEVEGRMEVSETIVTGPKALLKGELHCRTAVIAGRIEGDVYAEGVVELQTGAQVYGNIHSKGLVIQPDCRFEGNCSMVTGEAS
ncbi:polymer-forming cytoskeletal protein [candidate division WOR-3 bacterium]|nr:polymer-forming cytoskeletal protein [candidate division WOR-3 bacterium]